MKLRSIKLKHPTPEKLYDKQGRCDLIHVGMRFEVTKVNRSTGEVYLDVPLTLKELLGLLR